MFSKKAEVNLKILAVIGLISLLLGAGAMFFWQTGAPQDVFVNYADSNANSLIPQIEVPAIVFQNITLNDSTVYDPVTNTCTATRHGMRIEIKPCVAQTPTGSNIQHNVNFTWNGVSAQNVSWIFVYEGQLQNGRMELWQNVSTVRQVSQHNIIPVSNYILTGIINFTNLGAPNASCQLGSTSNNTQMYRVNLYNSTSGYTPRTICFTQANSVNATTFSLNGFADQYVQVNQTTWAMGWRDISSSIEFMGFGLLDDNRSYYRTQNVIFQPQQSYYTRWTYTPANQSELGKWHILGYNTNLGLTQAIVQDAYIYVDPWWNNNWQYKRAINVSNYGSRTIVNFTLFSNISYYAGMSTNFSDIRIVNSLENSELYYHIYSKIDSNSANVRINIPSLAPGNQTIWLYYGNPAVGSTSNANLTYPFYLDCSGNGVYGFPDPAFSGGACVYTGTSGGGSGNNYASTADFDVTQDWRADYEMSVAGANDGYVGFTTSAGDTSPSYYGYLAPATLWQSNHFGTFANLNPYTLSGWMNISQYWNGSRDRLEMSNGFLDQRNGSQTGSRKWSILNNKWDSLSYKYIWIVKNLDPNLLNYSFGSQEENSGVGISLQSPANNTFSSNPNITFIANQTSAGATTLTNTTLRVYNGSGLYFSNFTVISGSTNQTTIIGYNFSDGRYLWSQNTYGSDNSFQVSVNRTLTVDTSPPIVTFNSPANYANFTTTSFPFNVTINVTSQDANPGTCWFTSTDNATRTPYACNSTVNVPFYSEGLKSITSFANDSLGTIANATRFVNLFFYGYTQTESGDPVAEGGQTTFTLYVNMTDIPGAQAFFKYNNTIYTPSTQVNTQNASTFTYVLNVPVGFGNSSGITQYWNWTFNITGIASDIVTTTQTQTVYSPSLSNCLAGGTQILNFSHYDEETKQFINFSNGNNLQIDLTLRSLIDDGIEFSYNATKTNSVDIVVCVANGVLNSTSYRLDLTGSYVATDFVQEFFYIDNGTVELSAVPQRYKWYDLLLTDSTTFLFTFLDENGIEVPGVIVETLRYYIGEGQFVEVERSKEDNNGETHIHLVEEDVIYKFRVTFNNQELFLSDQYNAKCLSSPCSISLSAQPEVDPFPTTYNNLPEGSWYVDADSDTRDVTLLFNLNATGTMNMTIYTADNNVERVVASGRTTASSGALVVNVPLQYGNATYYASVFLNDDFVGTRVVDLNEDANDYFGAMGLFLGALAILCLALMGASHGEWVIVWTVLGMITASTLYLIDLPWYAMLAFIAGAGVFLIKLVSRRRIG